MIQAQIHLNRFPGSTLSAGALLMVLAMAGCVAVPATTPPPAPVAPAAPRLEPVGPVPSPYGTAIARVPDAPAPAATPVAAVPVPSRPAVPAAPTGPRDGRTGLHQAAVVAVTGDATRGFSVLYRPTATDAASVSAAPAKLCGGSGVASSATNSPRAGSAMPGVNVMVVKCGAA